MIYATVTIDAGVTQNIVVDAETTEIVNATAEITDIITADASISENVSADAEITSDITADAILYTSVRSGDYETYRGAYEVVPLARTEQTLETANKLMTDDVTVHKVPYYETTNDHGTTVFIAEV